MAVIKPIRNDQDHFSALWRINELLDSPEGSEEYDECKILAILVDRYEDTRWHIDAIDAVDVLRYVMEQRNLSVPDLVPYIGQKSHVYEILNRRRRLSTLMIWRLHKGLGIPSDLLIRPIQLIEKPKRQGENDINVPQSENS